MPENDPAPIDWKVESQRFDAVASLYEKYRPGYPAELIEDIVTFSGLQPGADILEIGSGTGKATQLFARRGFSIHCLEPGENLLNVAKASLQAYPTLRFERARFEEWEAGQRKFDLLFSAQAFHWVPKAVRFAKAASVLKSQGHLAIFWNMYPGGDSELERGVNRIYREIAPEIAREDVPLAKMIQERATSLRKERQFEQVQVRTYPWVAQYQTEAYCGLLNTYSDHLRLPEAKRQVLFRAIAELIERHGGQIEKAYLAVLYLARRR